MTRLTKNSGLANVAALYVGFLSSITFLAITFQHATDYQDAWILDGLVVPFLVYAVVFSIALVMTDNLPKLTIIATLFSVSLNLVPGLKYGLFYGVGDDLDPIYSLVHGIVASGHVPSGNSYSGTPGMQILIAAFSMIDGVSPDIGMKFAVPLAYAVFPPLVYFISKSLVPNETLNKYIIVSSALPLIAPFDLSGTVFALPFLLCTFALPIMIGVARHATSRNYVVLNVVLLIGFVNSHTLTPLFFLMFLVSVVVGLFASSRLTGGGTVVNRMISCLMGTLLTASLVFFAWWMFEAKLLFAVMVDNIHQAFLLEFRKPSIPLRFFELSLAGKLQIFLVSYVGDLIVVILMFLGLLTFVKQRRDMLKERFLYICLIMLFVPMALIIMFELATRYGDLEYWRFIYYFLIFSPFLAGLGLYKLKSILTGKLRGRGTRFLMSMLVLMIILISVVQFYRYQPLVPTGAALQGSLSKEDYMTYLHQVNTYYQVHMIYFVSSRCPRNALVASDWVTRSQIAAFSNTSLGSAGCVSIYQSQLSSSNDLNWDLLLLHDKRSAPFIESLEYRTADRLESTRDHAGWNVVYDGGGSFVVERLRQQQVLAFSCDMTEASREGCDCVS